MKKWPFPLFAVLLMLTGCITAPPEPPSLGEQVELRPEARLVPVVIDGHSFQLKVTPSSMGGIVLNPAAATRAGLEGMRAALEIGSVRVDGESRVSRVTIGSWSGPQRIAWFDRDIEPSADGTISIARLPYDRVALRQRPSLPEERSLVFDITKAFFADINFHHVIDGETIIVRFEPDLAQSTASAAAGALLARRNGGQWDGAARTIPIGFAVERPARPMLFAHPLTLNGLAIPRLMVRTADYNGEEALPPEGITDPSEIVVTGNSKQKPAYIISLGSDILSACSSMTYARAERQLVMTCQ